MNDSTIAQFNELRLLIEREVTGPAIITVTSATPTDGASFAAFGIADSLAASSHRTLLMRAVSDGAAASIKPMRKIGENALFSIDATDEAITATSTRESVNATFKRLREAFGFVIIDAGALPQRPLASMLAGFSDATLIALRSGRSRCSNDAALARAIASDTFTVLGVVATAKPAIAAFERMELVEHPGKRRLHIGSVSATI